MSPGSVVDASVVLKWVLNEGKRAPALDLLDDFRAGRRELICPEILLAEVASALARLVRRKGLSRNQALAAYEAVVERCPVVLAVGGGQARALAVALDFGISLWDANYVALALEYDCDVITADVRLLHAMRGRGPVVRELGRE